MWDWLPWVRRRRIQELVAERARQQQRAEYEAAVERLLEANRGETRWNAPTARIGVPLLTYGQKRAYRNRSGRYA